MKSTTTVLTNATIVDATRTQASVPMTIIIHRDRIVDISSDRPAVSEDAEVIDLTGRYVIPGLWDMHVNALVPDLMPWQHAMMIAHGVVGFRDCGADPRVAAELRDRPDPGQLVPDFVHAGPALDGVPPLNPAIAQPLGSPAEVSATLGTLASAGVDFLVTNSLMSQAVFGRVMEEANRLNKKVTVQGPLAYGYRYAARRGAGSIETLSNLVEEASVDADAKKATTYRTAVHRQDTTSNMNALALFAAHEREERLLFSDNPAENVRDYDEAVARTLAQDLAQTGVYFCPQVLLIEDLAKIDELQKEPNMAYVPEPIRQMWTGDGLFGRIPFDEYTTARKAVGEQYLAHALHFVGELHRAGVPILAGTHTILPFVYPGLDLHHELELLVRAGLSPHEALKTATYYPARYLDKTDDYGTIEKGKLANLVILDDNPLVDIRHTRSINTVVKSGTVLRRKALDKMIGG